MFVEHDRDITYILSLLIVAASVGVGRGHRLEGQGLGQQQNPQRRERSGMEKKKGYTNKN